MRVVVRRSVQVRPLFVTMSGRTEAARTIPIKAESSGTITQPAGEGWVVDKGALLCARRAGPQRGCAGRGRIRPEGPGAEADRGISKGWASQVRRSGKTAMDRRNPASDPAPSSTDADAAPFKGVFSMAGVGEFLGLAGRAARWCSWTRCRHRGCASAPPCRSNLTQRTLAPGRWRGATGHVAMSPRRRMRQRMFRVEIEIATRTTRSQSAVSPISACKWARGTRTR